MKTLFFGFNLIAATLVQFDTQDNVYKEAFDCEWKQQIGQENDQDAKYGVKRLEYQGESALKVYCSNVVKAIRLNNFPYSYKVQKTDKGEWLVTSKYFDKYWDETENIEIFFLTH